MEEEQQVTYRRQRAAASAFGLAWLTLQADSRRSAFGRPSAEEAVCRSTKHRAEAPGDPLVGAVPWVADRDAERPVLPFGLGCEEAVGEAAGLITKSAESIIMASMCRIGRKTGHFSRSNHFNRADSHRGVKFNARYHTREILQEIKNWRQLEGVGRARKLSVHADNARPSMTKLSMDFFEANNMRRVPHSPY
jgi:hypothetical protein